MRLWLRWLTNSVTNGFRFGRIYTANVFLILLKVSPEKQLFTWDMHFDQVFTRISVKLNNIKCSEWILWLHGVSKQCVESFACELGTPQGGSACCIHFIWIKKQADLKRGTTLLPKWRCWHSANSAIVYLFVVICCISLMCLSLIHHAVEKSIKENGDPIIIYVCSPGLALVKTIFFFGLKINWQKTNTQK